MGENKSKNLTCEDEKLLVREGIQLGEGGKERKKQNCSIYARKLQQ